jgi:hypothetical protein
MAAQAMHQLAKLIHILQVLSNKECSAMRPCLSRAGGKGASVQPDWRDNVIIGLDAPCHLRRDHSRRGGGASMPVTVED